MTNKNEIKEKLQKELGEKRTNCQFDKDVYLKTPTNKKLYSMLRKILDYDDFVYGIMDFCETDENQQKMIEVIESGVNNSSEISLWALSIADGVDINKLKAKWL